ncbi:MAG TPA: hypothetical protein VFH50_00735 [Acidimicrobiales bacterium]|nr:hypothetical protein [Acidimicrobiales bacterium]
MIKRLFYLAVGMGMGFGLSLWLTRLVRSTIERYTPERVSADVSASLRRFGEDIRAAVADGREAMREREAELRESLAARR